MNVFYETLSGVLEEIRSEGMEREYVILPEEFKMSRSRAENRRKKFEALLGKSAGRKRRFWKAI